MRFMMLMIPNGAQAAEYNQASPGGVPSAESVAAMSKYNQALTKAGVLLALDGLHPPAAGARVAFSGGKATVTDGPFSEAKEVIGGYWMIQVKSREEAIEWASRGARLRQRELSKSGKIHEMRDFPAEVAGSRVSRLRVMLRRAGML